MWNFASLKFCHGSVMFERPTESWSSVVRKMAYLPVRIANPGNSAADTMFWYSFRILLDRLRLIRLYSCGSLGPGITFIFGAWACHFAATPHSDVVRHMVTCFGRHGDAFGTTENAFFRAFITLRSKFHLHHRFQWALTEIVSKITPNFGLVL